MSSVEIEGEVICGILGNKKGRRKMKKHIRKEPDKRVIKPTLAVSNRVPKDIKLVPMHLIAAIVLRNPKYNN